MSVGLATSLDVVVLEAVDDDVTVSVAFPLVDRESDESGGIVGAVVPLVGCKNDDRS